jgi:REP element-mobilizing transposase RayT
MSYNDLTKGRYSQAGQEYHITFTTQGRTLYFTQFNAAHLFCQTLQQLQYENKIHPICWVLMPDHIHLLLQLQDGENLRKTLQHLKGRSAHTINKASERSGPLWQKNFF